jgi:hypothetical protein
MKLEKFVFHTVLILLTVQELIYRVKCATKTRGVTLQDFTLIFWAKIPTSGASISASINCKNNESINFIFKCNQYETELKMIWNTYNIYANGQRKLALKVANLPIWKHVSIFNYSVKKLQDF